MIFEIALPLFWRIERELQPFENNIYKFLSHRVPQEVQQAVLDSRRVSLAFFEYQW